MICKYPFFVKSSGGVRPCGQCLPCRINKRREKTFRIVNEALIHPYNSFITLTYSEEFLPKQYIDQSTGEVFEHDTGTLKPTDLQGFFNRLRHYIGPFRYFAVGEYGDILWRPHYHICLFAHHPDSVRPFIKKAWTDKKKLMCDPNRLQCVPLIKERMQYVCGYTVKKMTQSKDDRLQGRYPERSYYSKGIGKNLVERFSYLKGHVPFIDIPRFLKYEGADWPLDRYLRQKILDEYGLQEQSKEIAEKDYKEKMRALRLSAETNFPHASPGFALEMEVKNQTRQKVLNIEKRHALKSRRS